MFVDGVSHSYAENNGLGLGLQTALSSCRARVYVHELSLDL
jgi:hypothetical protein